MAHDNHDQLKKTATPSAFGLKLIAAAIGFIVCAAVAALMILQMNGIKVGLADNMDLFEKYISLIGVALIAVGIVFIAAPNKGFSNGFGMFDRKQSGSSSGGDVLEFEADNESDNESDNGHNSRPFKLVTNSSSGEFV